MRGAGTHARAVQWRVAQWGHAAGQRALPSLLLLPALLVLLVAFVLPLASALGESLRGTGGGWSAEWYGEFLRSDGYRSDLWFTLWTAGLTVVGSLLIALPVALVLRRPFPGRALLHALVLVPLIVPHLIAAYALRLTLSPAGPLFTALRMVGILADPPRLVNQWSGLVIAMTWKFFPVLTLTLTAALANVPPQLEEAAQDLGAGPLVRLRAITIPLIVPGMLAGGALVFILAAAQFSITLVILGGVGTTTIPLDVYTEALGLNRPAYAAALGTILTLTTLSLLALVTNIVRRRTRDGLA